MTGPSIITVRGKTPEIGAGSFLAEGARLVGDIVTGPGCSIWYNCVLRGDVGPIRIGRETNIQDGTVVHGTFNKAFAKIGNRVTVGHSVVLHGCEIGDLCLIGMGSLIMDNAKISARCVVGAGTLITEEFQCGEEGWLILGRPGKLVRKLKPEELAFLDKSADNYLHYKSWYEEEESKNQIGVR